MSINKSIQKPEFNKCIPKIKETFLNDDDLRGYARYATFAVAKERAPKLMPEQENRNSEMVQL